jgi:hypothetical protein
MVAAKAEDSVGFRLDPGNGVWLEHGRKARFSRIAESCDLDDGLGISCQWKFGTVTEANDFFTQLRDASHVCLGYDMTEERITIDPNATNEWKAIRRATPGGKDGFELEVVEYGVTYYVGLDVDPTDIEAWEKP